MPRTKEQFAQMRIATQQKILEAAMQLFVQKGFAPTSVQDIADLAGVSVGLVYRHFASKDALFAHIVQGATEGLAAVTQSLEQDGDPAEQMRALAQEMYDDMAKGDDLCNLMVLISQAFLSHDATPGLDALIAQDTQMIRAAAHVIQRGQQSGAFSPGDPLQMATLFYSSIQGLGLMKHTMGAAFIMPVPELLTAFLHRKEGST